MQVQCYWITQRTSGLACMVIRSQSGKTDICIDWPQSEKSTSPIKHCTPVALFALGQFLFLFFINDQNRCSKSRYIVFFIPCCFFPPLLSSSLLSHFIPPDFLICSHQPQPILTQVTSLGDIYQISHSSFWVT